MPQMMPMLWMIMLIFISIIMMFLMSMIFFSSLPPMKSMNLMKLTLKWNWLW